MSEEKTVVSEETKVETQEVVTEETGAETTKETPEEETQEVTPDSSIEDIDKAFSKQEEAEPSEESTTEKVEQTDKTAEVEKTDKVEVDTTEKTVDKVKEGEPVPYDRFKQVNTDKKTYRSERDTAKSELDVAQSDLKEAREALNDPDVLTTLMRKRGFTDEAITKYIQEKGLTAVKKAETEFDPAQIDGWKAHIREVAKEEAEKATSPLNQKLTKSEQVQQEAETKVRNDKEFAEVTKIAETKFGLKMGEAKKDEDNPDTAVGIMTAYLDAHPDEKFTGYIQLFKTAMFGRGEVIAKELGKKEEKERVKKVKEGAMESESTVSVDTLPGKDATIEEIDAYFNKHN